jgi:hypothetical protein
MPPVSPASHLTIGQVAKFFDAPEWKIRRIVDSLTPAVPRIGLYRLVPRAMLPEIGAKLQTSPPAAVAAEALP